jgi:alcohol dehydrogenase (cytochrome c)
LALDPDTGKIVWHHQYVPGETHDLDEGFESILVDHDGRTSLFEMGKFGILWELDRSTGKFLSVHDLGYQNIIDVDPETGKVTYRPGMIPKPGVPVDYCPNGGGIKTWRAMSYHPDTKAFYIPTSYGCARTSFVPVDFVEGGGNNSIPPYIGTTALGGHPNPKHPEPGDFIAMDIRTGKVLWHHTLKTGPSSAALTTAGGLAIFGDSDRYLYVHDVDNGKLLYQTRLPTSVTGFPISYSVRGKQYLAIVAGRIQFPPFPPGTAVPPTQPGPGGTRYPTTGNAIYVFALPE